MDLALDTDCSDSVIFWDGDMQTELLALRNIFLFIYRLLPVSTDDLTLIKNLLDL